MYLDDVSIFAESVKDRMKHADKVFKLLQDAGISLNLCKCPFFRKSVDYLGQVLLPGILAVAKDSSSAIADGELLRDKTPLGSFLGPCNDVHRFIKAFSHLDELMNRCIRKGSKQEWD